jgi:hypothetical protein
MVGTIIVAAAAGVSAAGVAASFALTAAAFAVNFAVSIIVSRVFGQSGQGPQDSGTRQQIPPSNINAIPIVYGDAYLGGTFVDAVLSTNQKTMYYVVAVSCVSPNGQFTFDTTDMYYGDRKIGFAQTLSSVSIVNGGGDYFVGQIIYLNSSYGAPNASLTVTSIGGLGNITGVSIATGGVYTVTPTNPITSDTGGATFNGTFTALNTQVSSLTDEAGNVDTKINGNLYINLYRSNAAGTITPLNGASAPNVVMGGADIDAALRWPSSGRQMNGLAFAIVKLNYNQDAGTTNLSPITFYAKHYLNSTGAAKPGDVWYDYITNPAYGGAVDPDFINASSATALNAYADQTITYTPTGGGTATQARYRMNGVLDAGQTVLSNLDKIMTCADSWMAYNAALGQWSIVINKAEATSYAFDDDNIIGEVRVSATDITQSINQVEAKFPDKGSRDQPNFVNISTPPLLLYPNEPTNKYSVTYDLCNDSVQAQYLANRILEQAREDLIVSFSTTYYGIQVDAGSVVSVTNADYGWTNKLFRVVKVNEASLPDGSLGAKLEMSEYSAAVYDDFDITQYAVVPNSDLPSVSYFSPLSAPTVSASNPSSAIPNFNISITIPAVGRVLFSELYYTTSPTPTSSDWQLLATASSIDGEPVTPSSTYVFANQVLPTGASPTATYYFAYIVGSDLAKSTRSPSSAAFTWTPISSAGATGPTGPQGATGSLGPTGPTGSSGETINGLTFINAYLVQSQASAIPTFTTPTSGSAIPSGWSATAPSVSVGQVMWYIQGRFNSNASVTINGVGPNTTAWTGPIAASIFQDIRSDNWNGSNPPVAATVGSWGTTGYYIERNTGNMFANGFYSRGVVKINGSSASSLGSTTAADINASGDADFGAVGFSDNSFGIGVVGYTSNASTGVGVQGTSTTNASYGVLAANNAGGTALYVSGRQQITNNTLVTNLNADLVDGLNASSFWQCGGSTVSLTSVGTGSSTGTFVGTTKPGASSTNTWITIVINGTTYYLPAWT